MNVAYNMDCLESMRQMPDNAFSLACVDPPYGNGGKDFKRSDKSRFGGQFDRYKKDREIIRWDEPPDDEYFTELFRVSENQIIWGGNYFCLPPTRCFLIWEKLTISENFSMAMAEYAWASFNDSAKIFKYAPQDKARFHPTQKPVALYDWIFRHYAKPGDKILDTHLGSGSSRIAAYKVGLDFVGFEIDKDYFDAQEKRFQEYTAQISFFGQGGN